MKNWITKSSKIVYKNSRFSIREDQVIRPDGTDGVYHVMDRPSVVVIVPITKNGKIYFIRINRYTTKKTRWELPAGSSDNQNELLAAKRELKEETGLTSNRWVSLGTIEVAPGMTGQLAYIFAARNVKPTKENKQKEENIDKMLKFPYKIVVEMIKKGEIVNGPTISAIMKVGLSLDL
ncbi:MAG: NUDIX hydrolase [Patescibacteria group bacterium]